MITKTIDLYKEYNINKKEGQKGFLHIYALENQKEVNLNRKYSAMLIIPGGGYYFTSSREMEPVALAYLNIGIQSFVFEYSESDYAKYPTQLLEGYMALNYINDHLEEFNIRSDRIGVTGFSAGAHLAGLLSNLHDLNLYKNSEQIKRPYLTVYGYPVICGNKEYGHYESFTNLAGNDEELITSLSIDKMVDKNTPNSFIFSTYEDSVVPIKNSILLAEALNDNKVKFEMHIFEKGEHGLSLGNINVMQKEMISSIIINNSKWFEFLKVYLNQLDFNVID